METGSRQTRTNIHTEMVSLAKVKIARDVTSSSIKHSSIDKMTFLLEIKTETCHDLSTIGYYLSYESLK